MESTYNEKEFRLRKDFGISDVLVDFLGALFPGLLFSVSIIITLGSTIFYLIHQIKRIILMKMPNVEDINSIEVFKSVSISTGYFSFYILILVLIISYVLGQFLFRKDPKGPDNASFKKVWGRWCKEKKEQQKKSWVEQVKPKESLSEYEIEYPYRYLKMFFKSRGLNHLANIVPWTDKTVASTRSKTFINLMKIRIRFFHPDKMGDILKNEGHIRLMSSIWYLCKYLKALSFFCILINLFVFSIGLFWTSETFLFLIIPTILSLIILGFAALGSSVIETFFHYQRVREVFFVLETAYTISMENKNIFYGIDSTS